MRVAIGSLAFLLAACGGAPPQAPPAPSRVRPVSHASRPTDTRVPALASVDEPESRPVAAPSASGCRVLLELAPAALTLHVEGRRRRTLARIDAGYPELASSLAGACAATIVAVDVPYARLVALMDAVSRAGVGDIVVGSDRDIEALALPPPPSSRYRRGAGRSARVDLRSPVIILGAGGLTLQGHADDAETAQPIAPLAALGEAEPFQELHRRLLATRAELPENASTLIVKADASVSIVSVTRALAAARSAGFVDVLFSTRE